MNASLIARNVVRFTVTKGTPSSYFCSVAQAPYKSSISLDNLYPNGQKNITTPSKEVGGQFCGYIPMDRLKITYSRSSGPGGQNVNMVNSKVDLRFNVQKATWISDDVKTKLLQNCKTQINKEGELVFRSELTRSQQLNLADCLNKVRSLIFRLSVPEPTVSEETQERIRRRHERAVRERLAIKRERSQVKNDRRDPVVND